MSHPVYLTSTGVHPVALGHEAVCDSNWPPKCNDVTVPTAIQTHSSVIKYAGNLVQTILLLISQPSNHPTIGARPTSRIIYCKSSAR